MSTIRIDRAHAVKLIRGETIAIKVPAGAKVIRFHLRIERENEDIRHKRGQVLPDRD